MIAKVPRTKFNALIILIKTGINAIHFSYKLKERIIEFCFIGIVFLFQVYDLYNLMITILLCKKSSIENILYPG